MSDASADPAAGTEQPARPVHRAVENSAWLNPPAYVEPGRDRAVPVDGYRESNGDILCNGHNLLYTSCYTCNPR